MEADLSVDLLWLFMRYNSELREINDGVLPGDGFVTDLELFHFYQDKNIFTWHPIFVGEEIVGFLLTTDGQDGNITEAYISPPYRKQGLMSAAVTRYLLGKRSCMYIVLKKNNNGLEFWNNLMSRLGYHRMEMRDGIDEGTLLVEWRK